MVKTGPGQRSVCCPSHEEPLCLLSDSADTNFLKAQSKEKPHITLHSVSSDVYREQKEMSWFILNPSIQ